RRAVRAPRHRSGLQVRRSQLGRPQRQRARGRRDARRRVVPVHDPEGGLTMAITEAEVPTTSLADLLERVEALEAEQKGQIKKKNKLTIIAWGGSLDQIWPTTILATTAAASGMEASVFFTFWGLFAIVKPGVRITGENWMQKMMSVMNPGSAQKAKLSHYH